MRQDAISLEEERLQEIHELDDYESIHERHRIFPRILKNRHHKKILDISAGVGVVGKRIQDHYDAEVICNDICPKCLSIMQKLGLQTVSFDIDNKEKAFPFSDDHFDGIIALATIEHLMHIDHFLSEIKRILSDKGYLYISAPNYSGLPYLLPFLLSGKTFHDPMSEGSRYEFYAHVKYFTYRTLLEVVGSFGFIPDSVYLPIPESSSNYLSLKSRSKPKALTIRYLMKFVYTFFSPRWASEPVICFIKKINGNNHKLKKVVI